MSWLSGFANRVEREAPVGLQTWYRLGGSARYLFRPRDEEELARLFARAKQEGVPVKVLGSGANVLVSDDGFDGVVVRLNDPAFRTVDRRGTTVTVGAGVDLMSFARQCSELGLSGLECMAGIPATVGGAVCMNAGGRSGEFGTVVRNVRLLRPDGDFETWSRDRLGFGYRSSNIGDQTVLSAELELVESRPSRVKRRFEECLEYKRRSQPLTERNAGCIFKNPPGQSAGALIDQAGLKGTSCGQAYVSEKHANFIVARRGATASEILRLIKLIRRQVRQMFATDLELEIDVWRPLHHAEAKEQDR